MNPYQVDYDVPTKPMKCCVLNCTDIHSRRHRFPKNYPDVYKQWLQNVRPVNYENLSVKDVYNKYYVCDSHFTPECFVPGTRRGLRKDAVPTISVPGKLKLNFLLQQVKLIIMRPVSGFFYLQI